MSSLYKLTRNEVMKIWKKRRFFVVLILIAVIIPLFTYAQFKVAKSIQEQLGTDDWRISVQEQINDYKVRMESPRVVEEWKKWYAVNVQQLEYYLDADIDPMAPSAVTFTREFIANSLSLMLPLLIMVIGSDLMSSEYAGGTIKLLLTRLVRRWKVLTSKYLALMIYVSLTIVSLFVLSYLISGIVFGYGGWNAPVLTGFKLTGESVDFSYVNVIPQWIFIVMEVGLAWFSCIVVACLALMISVLVRSTAAGMGIMLATLITGTILTNMTSSWESAKYFFMVNLNTVSYLTGDLPPIEGMTLSFSLILLSVWAFASVIVSYVVFTKQDILN